LFVHVFILHNNQWIETTGLLVVSLVHYTFGYYSMSGSLANRMTKQRRGFM